MNVFVLSTGRCGSLAFIQACRHITNFTAGHETRCRMVGDARLDYPADHIESDNRLSWLLGRLDRKYGDDAVYVHLFRDAEKVAASFVKRYGHGMIAGYRDAVLRRPEGDPDPMAVARDYCDTVNANIAAFLKDKSRKMDFDIADARNAFPRFWELVGAQGDLDAALVEFETPHNASKSAWSRVTGRLRWIMGLEK